MRIRNDRYEHHIASKKHKDRIPNKKSPTIVKYDFYLQFN